ncbi:MAG: hypothetical protein GAKPKEKM_02869 [Rhodocyclaceae bacterium]|nr:hypothetical protein [Rhodocyclaceae bacterium]
MLSTCGNTIAHGSDGSRRRHPYGSPLMKLPRRPKPSPGGTSGAMKSITANQASFFLRAYKVSAASTP